MVAPEDAPAQHTPDNTGGTFGKLKQTLSSSLLTAQDKGNTKMFVVLSFTLRSIYAFFHVYIFFFFFVIVLFKFKDAALKELIVCMRLC